MIILILEKNWDTEGLNKHVMILRLLSFVAVIRAKPI